MMPTPLAMLPPAHSMYLEDPRAMLPTAQSMHMPPPIPVSQISPMQQRREVECRLPERANSWQGLPQVEAMPSPLFRPPSLSSQHAFVQAPPSPIERRPSREPLPLPVALQDGAGGSRPSHEDLSVEERFVDAYATQIGYLQHAAKEEMARVQSDVNALRKVAYQSQKRAQDHALQADMARNTLHDREQQAHHLQRALHRTRAELAMESQALVSCRNSLLHGEALYSQAESRAEQEIAEIKVRCSAMSQRRKDEQQHVANLEQELAATRGARTEEAQKAKELANLAEMAAAETKQAKIGLAWRDSVAEEKLREAVQRMEDDFARERVEVFSQDARYNARLRAIQHNAQSESWGSPVHRALLRPQVSAVSLHASSPVAEPRVLVVNPTAS